MGVLEPLTTLFYVIYLFSMKGRGVCALALSLHQLRGSLFTCSALRCFGNHFCLIFVEYLYLKFNHILLQKSGFW